MTWFATPATGQNGDYRLWFATGCGRKYSFPALAPLMRQSLHQTDLTSLSTNLEPIFRRTCEQDVEALFSIRERTRENPVSRVRLATLGITPTSAAASLRSGDIVSWVCEYDSTVVGFCSGEMATGEVLVLAVLPDYEGKGIGRGLVALVTQDLRDFGHQRLWLAASPDPALRSYGFYRSAGWRSSGGTDSNGDEILVLD
jgi:GNAT superfamily N-acetyltransferase